MNERLTQAAALPNVSRPPQMIQPLSSTSRLMMIGLSSEDRSLIDLGVAGSLDDPARASWASRGSRTSRCGVSESSSSRCRSTRQRARATKGVTLDQVIRTTGNALWVSPLTFLEASTPGTGGFYRHASAADRREHIQPIKTPEDLAEVTLERATTRRAAAGGRRPQRLGDVATVVEDHQPSSATRSSPTAQAC